MKRSFSRPKNVRLTRQVIYVVCEGSVTEKEYFGHLRQLLKLANVQIETRRNGLSPSKVCDIAEEVLNDKLKSAELVFCVFDHDDRDDEFLQAKARINARPDKRIVCCSNRPCFEFWLLLHYTFSTRQFVSISGGKTAAAQVIDELRKHFINFNKNDATSLRKIAEDLDRVKTAITHANRLGCEINQNPHTGVAKLAEKLFEEAAKTSGVAP